MVLLNMVLGFFRDPFCLMVLLNMVLGLLIFFWINVVPEFMGLF